MEKKIGANQSRTLCLLSCMCSFSPDNVPVYTLIMSNILDVKNVHNCVDTKLSAYFIRDFGRAAHWNKLCHLTWASSFCPQRKDIFSFERRSTDSEQRFKKWLSVHQNLHVKEQEAPTLFELAAFVLAAKEDFKWSIGDLEKLHGIALPSLTQFQCLHQIYQEHFSVAIHVRQFQNENAGFGETRGDLRHSLDTIDFSSPFGGLPVYMHSQVLHKCDRQDLKLCQLRLNVYSTRSLTSKDIFDILKVWFQHEINDELLPRLPREENQSWKMSEQWAQEYPRRNWPSCQHFYENVEFTYKYTLMSKKKETGHDKSNDWSFMFSCPILRCAEAIGPAGYKHGQDNQYERYCFESCDEVNMEANSILLDPWQAINSMRLHLCRIGRKQM